MSATGPTEAERGFTLLEMLVVMAVTALIAALGWPAVERGIGAAQFRSQARSALSLLVEARARAVAQGRAVRFAPADSAELPDVRWTLPRGGLTFHADGSASGGEVLMQAGERRARFAVEPTTGTIRPL